MRRAIEALLCLPAKVLVSLTLVFFVSHAFATQCRKLADDLVPTLGIEIPVLRKFTDKEIDRLKTFIAMAKTIEDLKIELKDMSVREVDREKMLAELAEMEERFKDKKEKYSTDRKWLFASLTPEQKEIVFKVMVGSGEDLDLTNLEKAAQLVAVTEALGWKDGATFQGIAVTKLRADIEAHNSKLVIDKVKTPTKKASAEETKIPVIELSDLERFALEYEGLDPEARRKLKPELEFRKQSAQWNIEFHQKHGGEAEGSWQKDYALIEYHYRKLAEYKAEENTVSGRLIALSPRTPIEINLTDRQHAIALSLLGKKLIDIDLSSQEIAAEVVAVVRALKLDESSVKFQGVEIAAILRTVESHNKKVLERKVVDAKLQTELADLQLQITGKATDKANAEWLKDPEQDYTELLHKAIQGADPWVKEEVTKLRKKYSSHRKELNDFLKQWTTPSLYSAWVIQTAKGLRPHYYSDIQDVRKAFESDEKIKALVTYIGENYNAAHLATLRRVEMAWRKSNQLPFDQLLSQELERQLLAAGQRIRADVAKKFSGLGNAPKLLLEEALNPNSDSNKVWMKKQRPDLAFGEAMRVQRSQAKGKLPANKVGFIMSLATIADNATKADLQLLQRILASFDVSLLKQLSEKKYVIKVVRGSLVENEASHGQRNASNELIEHLGASLDPQAKVILLRSKVVNGQLTVDLDQFLSVLGEVYNADLKGGEVKPSEEVGFAKAYAEESRYLPLPHSNQHEFFYKAFAAFNLDPARINRNLPQSSQHLKMVDFIENRRSLRQTFADMQAPLPFTVSPAPSTVLGEMAKINGPRKASKQRPLSVMIELKGETLEKVLLAKRLALEHSYQRSPDSVPLSSQDGFIEIDASTFNNAKDLQSALDKSLSFNGAVLFIRDASSIDKNSSGFAVLKKYFEATGDFSILVVGGDTRNIAHRFPSLIRHQMTILPLTPEQVAEVVLREAQDEGFVFSAEARQELIKTSSSGPLESTEGQWPTIKNAQAKRASKLAAEVQKQPEAVNYVLSQDVKAVQVSSPRPMDAINDMIGLLPVKEKVKAILARVSLARQEAAMGISTQGTRQNLLFVGNPGTGKTTVADSLALGLFQEGFVKKRGVAKLRVQDLVAQNPEATVKRVFEENKDAVIFIDEFHQLKDSDNGKRAFRAMIPYLADPEYKNTVFIGAGYKAEIRELVREIDPGGERRFSVIEFPDYSKDELRLIAVKMLKDQKLIASEEVVGEILNQVVRKQRSMKHPGNAGDVESIIGLSQEKQRARLHEEAKTRSLSAKDLTTLKLEDVHKKPSLKVEEVWAEINKLKGLEEAKQKLREIQDLLDYNRALGEDILSGVEPYIILDGPAGAGKSTLAQLIGKLFAANDVVPEAELVKAVGGELVGGFVGNSSPLAVRKLFESAWGKTLFIDEIGALAKAPGGFEDQSAKEMLTQMENHRGKFILVVADYPGNIDQFLRLDAGLARRFGARISLESMSGSAGAELLLELLAQVRLDAKSFEAVIAEKMSELSSLPAWASGGDIRTLASKVRTYQAAEFMSLKREGKEVDPLQVLPAALEKAFESLEREIKKRPAPRGSEENQDKHSYNYQYKKATAEEKAKEELAALTEQEKETLEAVARVGHQFGHRLNDPAVLKREQEDKDSEYNQALARELNTTVEQAMEKVKKAKAKAKVFVTVMEKELKQHFKYHCPFCGRVDSPDCAYIGYPMAWKLEHSLKKPWTEEIIRTRTEEQEIEIEIRD